MQNKGKRVCFLLPFPLFFLYFEGENKNTQQAEPQRSGPPTVGAWTPRNRTPELEKKNRFSSHNRDRFSTHLYISGFLDPWASCPPPVATRGTYQNWVLWTLDWPLLSAFRFSILVQTLKHAQRGRKIVQIRPRDTPKMVPKRLLILQHPEL